MKKIGIITSLLCLNLAFANSPKNLSELLNRVQNHHSETVQQNKAREAKFIAAKKDQAKLLSKAKANLKRVEARTKKLQADFSSNEKELSVLEQKLLLAKGNLGEIFGVIHQVSADLSADVTGSIVSAQLKGRTKFLDKIADQTKLASIQDIKGLWFELQREMTLTGQIVSFTDDVVLPNGDLEKRQITRVGPFNLISDGKYLNYIGETEQITELAKQPQSKYLSTVSSYLESSEPYTNLSLDPTRGVLLSRLVLAPSILDRVEQGGIVGMVILFLLGLGLILVGERLVVLSKEKKKIISQLQSAKPEEGTPLGDIIAAYEKFKNEDLATLEKKLEESVLKILPVFQKNVGTIKILAAVAPLLGLLGTVTGMISTFQAITLFGSGDPKIMAGGISSALVTTVLGLVCAIPLLLLHNVVASKSKFLIQLIEEQSLGLLAKKSELELAKN